MIQRFFDSIRRSKAPIGDYYTISDVLEIFDEPVEQGKDWELVFAVYDSGNWEGSASVIFYDRKTKKYYEASGSHCSCYGLENQFAPEELVPKEFENRIENGSFAGRAELQSEYKKWLDKPWTKRNLKKWLGE